MTKPAYFFVLGEYVASYRLPESRISEITSTCGAMGMSLEQALSLRKQLAVQKIMEKSSSMRRDMNYIKKKYASGVDIASLSRELDQPAVAMLRAIILDSVRDQYQFMEDRDRKNMVKQALRGEGQVFETLSERDKVQLEHAKTIDQMSFSEDPFNERQTSMEWEMALYGYLDEAGIKYLKEEEMQDAGFSSTPDVVILDDLFINGRCVKWIDSKCFYGSGGSSLFVKKLILQSKRYDEAFAGSGAIIYRLGFSRDLQDKLAHALLLDSGPLPLKVFDPGN